MSDDGSDAGKDDTYGADNEDDGDDDDDDGTKDEATEGAGTSSSSMMQSFMEPLKYSFTQMDPLSKSASRFSNKASSVLPVSLKSSCGCAARRS